MLKKIFMLVFILIFAIVWFIYNKVVGSELITLQPVMTSEQLEHYSNDTEFKNFIQQFQPVSLPLKLKSDKIRYADLTPVTIQHQKYIPANQTTADVLASAGIDTSQIPQVALDSIVPIDPNVEGLAKKHFYLPFINNNWVAVLVVYKQYNDALRNKQVKIELLTYNWDGARIDSRILGIESINYDHNNEILSEHYVMLNFDHDKQISLWNKTWRYVDRGGYASGGWISQPGWSIASDGKINAVEKSKLIRDE